MYGVVSARFKSPGGVVVKFGLKVCSGATLRFDAFLSVGIEANVSTVVGCVVAMTVECCGMGVEVGSLLVSVLTTGLAVDCSIVVVDVGVVCCSVAPVLLVVELVVVAT